MLASYYKGHRVPVPEDDEVVVEIAPAALGVLLAVGDDLANLAGLGGVAGGVAAVFGVGSGLAFGLAAAVAAAAAFALSSVSVGFFAVAGGFCFQDVEIVIPSPQTTD